MAGGRRLAGGSRGVVDLHRCFGQGEFGATLRRKIPGQELPNVFRRPVARGGAAFQVPRKPATRVQTPLFERCHDREHGVRRTDAPERAAAVIVLSPHGWTADDSLRSVIVHGDLRVVGKQRQARPVVEQTRQRFAARLAEFWLSQFFGGLLVHRLDRLTQRRIARCKLVGFAFVRKPLPIQMVQVANATQPRDGPKSVSSGQPLPTAMKSRRTRAQQNTKITVPDLT